jgi:hypothetical protein
MWKHRMFCNVEAPSAWTLWCRRSEVELLLEITTVRLIIE